jgi:hypothetical protein
MSAILLLLQTIVPMIPKLIETGVAGFDLFDKVREVITENRIPDSAEWDALEAQIAADQAIVRDKSRDTD